MFFPHRQHQSLKRPDSGNHPHHRQKRIRDHEKYLRQKERKQKIAEGLIVPGEPYQLVCQCCGEPSQSVRPNAKFCKPACREKFYRQEKRKAKETETSQTA